MDVDRIGARRSGLRLLPHALQLIARAFRPTQSMESVVKIVPINSKLQTLNTAVLAILGLLAAGCLARGANGPAAPRGYDPVTRDQPARDSVHPPRLAELAFESAGARLNGIFYLPAGAGPHPVVVLLHGNPGNERNLDVAQALRRAGYATLYFNYRGSWGSGGTFSRTHAIEDVHAALRFVRSPLAAERYRVDSARVALVGHSMGGWLALVAAAGDPRVGCVGALDFVNTGARGRRLLSDRAADSARMADDARLTAPGGPYRVEGGGAALVAEVKANADRWDVLAYVPALRERRVLLVGSANRTEHDSLVTALGGPHGSRLTVHWWPTDHSFSDRRIALARAILQWLGGPCGL